VRGVREGQRQLADGARAEGHDHHGQEGEAGREALRQFGATCFRGPAGAVTLNPLVNTLTGEDAMKSRFVIPACLLVAFTLAAVAQDDPEPPYKARSYKTPQAVFDALVAAMTKKDYRTMVDCYSPEAMKQLAAEHAFQGLMFRDTAEGRDKDKDKLGKRDDLA